jgi:hypothetical protein
MFNDIFVQIPDAAANFAKHRRAITSQPATPSGHRATIQLCNKLLHFAVSYNFQP